MTQAEKRLLKANEYLQEAEFLYNERISNIAVMTKLYHAMIYSLFALFDIRDIGTQRHADLIERFERDYVGKGLFNITTLKRK